jgi:EpsI family protein
MPRFLRSRYGQVLSLFLIAQIGVFYAYPKTEVVSQTRPLKQVPQDIQHWKMVQESELDSEVQALLKADDTLNRVYGSVEANRYASLYIAYFKTQRTGVSPHSPKVCLPGSGWVPSESERIQIQVPGLAEPLNVNRYIVSKGDERSTVLYWYQSSHRSIASEYAAKVYTVLDSVRYRRSDTSLVRVVVPHVGPNDKAADAAATKFVQETFSTLRPFLPHA